MKTIACNAGITLVLFFAAGTALIAQDHHSPFDQIPGIRERAVILHVVSRIIEQNKEVSWNSENTSITMPGRPVGLQLVGSDVVVAVQFTPFLRPNGQHTLVAHGQIWVNIPGEGISFQTTMQTIPLEFGELIYFFPLGSIESNNDAQIEIQLLLEPLADGSDAWRRQNQQENTPGRGPRSNPR